MAIGRGVRIRNRSSGGGMRSGCEGRAKQAAQAAGGGARVPLGSRREPEDREAQFGRGDPLEICRVGEEGEHSLGWQRQVYRGSENVERQANYRNRSRTTASLLAFTHTTNDIQ